MLHGVHRHMTHTSRSESTATSTSNAATAAASNGAACGNGGIRLIGTGIKMWIHGGKRLKVINIVALSTVRALELRVVARRGQG